MKVFPKRTNETAMRCVLEGAGLEALLVEAAAKAAGVDLSAHNVKVSKVTVESPDHDQHRREPRVFVDLLVLHDSDVLADWVAGKGSVKPPPPEPPPMRCPATEPGYRPGRINWVIAHLIVWGLLICWCLGVGMK